ncbi:hypothetical protein Dimus_005135 [Dionaea muscipula]
MTDDISVKYSTPWNPRGPLTGGHVGMRTRSACEYVCMAMHTPVEPKGQTPSSQPSSSPLFMWETSTDQLAEFNFMLSMGNHQAYLHNENEEVAELNQSSTLMTKLRMMG